MSDVPVTTANGLFRFTPADYDLAPHHAALLQLQAAYAEAEDGGDEKHNAALLIKQRQRWIAEIEQAIERVSGQVPVYLLSVPTEQQKRAFRINLASLGCDYYPSDLDRYTVLRRAIRELGDDGDVPIDMAIAAVEDAQSCAVTGDAMGDDLIEVLQHLSETAMAYPPYRRLMQKRAAYGEYAPYVAMRMFLAGWEHGPGDFRRRADGVPDDVLALIDRAHQTAIGNQCLALMSVSPVAAKKSVPPSKSSPALPPSTTSEGMATESAAAATAG